MRPEEFIKKYKPCDPAEIFCKQFETMAEAWEKCPRPDWIIWALEHMGKLPDDRTLRLFACWCVRNTPLVNGQILWDLLTDERCRRVVETAEQYANGQVSSEELVAVWSAATATGWSVARDAALATAGPDPLAAVFSSAEEAIWSAAYEACATGNNTQSTASAAKDAARAAQANRLREIIPNPFEEGER